jgi:hypothetical protein
VSLTIVRHDGPRPIELILGQDVTEEQADWFVEAGVYERGPDYVLPPAVYLREPIEIGGLVRPAGTMLHVGGEISEGEALLLIRGHMFGGDGPASIPGGGVG